MATTDTIGHERSFNGNIAYGTFKWEGNEAEAVWPAKGKEGHKKIEVS